MPANRFIPLMSSQSGAVPSASVLYPGELAVNIADGLLFTRSGSHVIELNSRDGLATLQSNTFLGNQVIDGNLTVDGTLTATQYNVYSSSFIYGSGSTKFGDTIDDIHQFTGSVIIDGPLDVLQDIKSQEFKLTAGNVVITFTGSVNNGIFGSTEFIYPWIPTESFNAATVEYVASRPGGVRVGILLTAWSGSQITSTDISSTDVGDTDDIRFNLVQVDGYVKLRAESLGSGSYPWTVQSLFKLFPALSY